jgi:hypothetical protein
VDYVLLLWAGDLQHEMPDANRLAIYQQAFEQGTAEDRNVRANRTNDKSSFYFHRYALDSGLVTGVNRDSILVTKHRIQALLRTRLSAKA